MKKFTVITVCYNCEAEIRDTIRSVLDQTCTDFEYLIKDGASQDGTVDAAKSFIPAFDEKIFRIRSFPNRIQASMMR